MRMCSDSDVTDVTSVGRQSGFVLLSTIWVLAIVLIIAAGFNAFVEQKIHQAILLRDSAQRRLDEYATEQTVSYLLMTQRYTRAGLTTRSETPSTYRTEEGYYLTDSVGGELLLDGTLYEGIGSTCFAIQDQAGLVGVGVDSASASDLRWVLSSMSVEPLTVDGLIDNLLDYIDENDLARLSGAEQDEYRNKSLPLPSNYFLRSPNELFRVMDWSEWLADNPEFLWWRWLSISRSVLINPNTLPPSLLRRLPGIDKGSVERVVSQRRQEPYKSLEDFNSRSGLRLNWPEERFRFLASDRVQLHIRSRGSLRLRVTALELTPSGLLGPLQQKYQYRATIPPDVLVGGDTGSELANGAELSASSITCKKSSVRLF